MITIDRSGELAILRMQAPKANSMSPAFLDALDRALDEVAGTDARAAVLTGHGKVFSAGLALPELIDLSRAGLAAFIDSFEDAMLRALECPLPLVAAINGHAIAGGCVLALMCDARVMAQGAPQIGLTEARIGIGLPAIVAEGLRLRVGNPAAVEIALGGALHDAAGAVRLGLVDAAVAPDEFEAIALARATTLATAPRAASAQIKAALVRPAVEAFARVRVAERERWVDTWFSDDGQRGLRDAVARLTRK